MLWVYFLISFFCCLVPSHSQPYFVAYVSFKLCTTSDACKLASIGVPGYSAPHPYNVLNFAFFEMSDGHVDGMRVWSNPSSLFSASTRLTIAKAADSSITGSATDNQFRTGLKKIYNDAGIKVLVSAFGAHDHPMQDGHTASATATALANVVLQYNLDGVDVDWEEGIAGYLDGRGELWLAELTTELRNKLGPNAIISHAPQSPYFMYGANYPQGGYLKVHELVGDKIDFYNMQFYNQGSTPYTTFDNLFVSSIGWSTNSAIYQMMNGNAGYPNNANPVKIPQSKIVLGKPCASTDGGVGWLSASALKSVIYTATHVDTEKPGLGYPQWSGGFMIWQFYSDYEQSYAFGNTVREAFDGITYKPTLATASPTTKQPTQPTTLIPTTAGPTFIANGNIQIANFKDTEPWWVAFYVNEVDNSCNSATVDEVYIRDKVSYLNWHKGSKTQWNYWAFGNTGQTYSIPLDIKIVNSKSEELIGLGVYTNYEDNSIFDFGSNFCDNNPTTPTPATPKPTTNQPTTSNPTSPGQTSKPTTLNPTTFKPTTSIPTTSKPTNPPGSCNPPYITFKLVGWATWYCEVVITESSKDIKKVEFKYDGSNNWLNCIANGNQWYCNQEETKAPVSIRVTAIDNEVLPALNGIISSNVLQTIFVSNTNFGCNGGPGPTPTPKPATPQPTTTKPTTNKPTNSNQTPQPTTNKPTTNNPTTSKPTTTSQPTTSKPTSSGSNVLGSWASGYATYHNYGTGSGQTSCGYTYPNDFPTNTFPYGYITAVSTDLVNGGKGCGACYEVKCTGNRGNAQCACTETESIIVQAIDLSGTTSEPHFDISDAAFPDIANQFCGNINIEFRQVSCLFPGNIKFKPIDGSSNWNLVIRFIDISNYGNLCGVELLSDGLNGNIASNWMKCTLKSNDQWTCDDSALEPTVFPIKIKLIDCGQNEIFGTMNNFNSVWQDFGSNYPTNSPPGTTPSPGTPKPTTSKPTAKPTTTSKPTTTPSPGTPKPTTTKSPTTQRPTTVVTESIKVQISSTSAWYFSIKPTLTGSAEPISKVEIKSNNKEEWLALKETSWDWHLNAPYALKWPLSFRLTSTKSNIQPITAIDVIPSNKAGTYDLKINFGGNTAAVVTNRPTNTLDDKDPNSDKGGQSGSKHEENSGFNLSKDVGSYNAGEWVVFIILLIISSFVCFGFGYLVNKFRQRFKKKTYEANQQSIETELGVSSPSDGNPTKVDDALPNEGNHQQTNIQVNESDSE